MRITFKLSDQISYNPNTNSMVIVHDCGGIQVVSLSGLDFVLHEDCRPPESVQVKNSLFAENPELEERPAIQSFSGVHLSMEQLVELVDAARSLA